MLEYVYLIIVGFIAGLINVVAGGGSLLTLPMLIFLGLPSHVANGTNRIAIIIQNIFAVKGFHSKGVSSFPFSIYISISALIGSLIGAYFAVDIKGDLFNKILSIVMVCIILYLVLKPKINKGFIEDKTKGKHLWYGIITFFFVGLYGGFIQAGVGFVIIALLTGINKFSLVKANAVKVFVALVYLVGALVIFAFNDNVSWKHGIILSIGTASGGWFMSRYSVKKGEKFIRILLIVTLVVLTLKLWFT